MMDGVQERLEKQPLEGEVRVWLSVWKGSESIGTLPVYDGVDKKQNKRWIVVGRKAKKADVVIDHKSVSSQHAAIAIVSPDEIWLFDLGSSNGTWLNGAKVNKNGVKLSSSQDCIRFGLSSISYFVHSKSSNSKEKERRAEESRSGLEDTTSESIKEKESQEESSREEREAAIRALAEEMMSSKATVKNQPKVKEHEKQEEKGRRDRVEGLPISRQVKLSEHRKVVCSLSVDYAGSRVATGGYDYKLSIWDFGGMNKDHKAFKVFTPLEGHVVRKLEFSPSGGHILVTPSDSKAFLFDRNGKFLRATVKGDPYIQDMSKTKGHPTVITDLGWHTANPNVFFTCSIDGTCRIWDLNGPKTDFDEELICTTIMKAKSARNARVELHSCAMNSQSSCIAAGASDGSVQLWTLRTSGQYNKPDAIIRPAHEPGEVTCVRFSSDGRFLASRSEHGSICLWNVQKMSGSSIQQVWKLSVPIQSNPESNVCFSPDGAMLVAGDSADASLLFIDMATGAIRHKLRLDKEDPSLRSAVCVEWHSKLNQIFAGCNDGSVRVLFDPDLSQKGALLSTAREAKAVDISSAVSTRIDFDSIILPNALPAFRKDKNAQHKTKSQRERQVRKDPVLSHQPQLPPSRPEDIQIRKGGDGGTFVKHIIQQVEQVGQHQVDHREDLLRHAREIEKERASKRRKTDLSGTLSVYHKTQPQTILSSKTLEQEEEELRQMQSNLAAYQKNNSS